MSSPRVGCSILITSALRGPSISVSQSLFTRRTQRWPYWASSRIPKVSENLRTVGLAIHVSRRCLYWQMDHATNSSKYSCHVKDTDASQWQGSRVCCGRCKAPRSRGCPAIAKWHTFSSTEYSLYRPLQGHFEQPSNLLGVLNRRVSIKDSI